MFTSDLQATEDKAISEVKARLRVKFSDRNPGEVARVVDAVTRDFTFARVRDYVPLLVERISRDELSHRLVAK